jgi:hypothetical protein
MTTQQRSHSHGSAGATWFSGRLTRRVVPSRAIGQGAAGEDGLGNTRMVSSVLGGRAERQALSAAISTMGQLQRDVTALQGALEQLESAADELVDDFAHDEEPHGSTTAFTSLTVRRLPTHLHTYAPSPPSHPTPTSTHSGAQRLLAVVGACSPPSPR